MLNLDIAIVNRWNAKGLNVSIGTLYDTRQPEGSALPYAVFENISDTKRIQTPFSRYHTALIQVQVYHTTKEACGALCELVDTAFKNPNVALTNPGTQLSVPGPDGIVQAHLSAPYILELVGDTVWQGTMTMSVTYRRDGGLQ